MSTAHNVHFRPDIEGLRGLAVLAVLAFHFQVPGFTGGFVGVDVFFVISGFVVTSMITAKLDANVFTFSDFYIRRAKRILPALLTVCAATLLTGYFLELPDYFSSTGQQAIYAALGISNFLFWQRTGYFDNAAETMLLLHTWSLSIELQFYLIWPILIVALHKTRYRAIIIFAVAILSLATSMYLVDTDPKAAFFHTWPRAWEFIAGGLTALMFSGLKSTKVSFFLSTLGITSIVAATLLYDVSLPFPGIAALIPVGGTVLLLVSSNNPVSSVILSTKPMCYLGRISYAVYLWHWPLLVFFRVFALGDMPTLIETAGLLVLTFLLAALSTRFIEQPVRKLPISPRSALAGAATGCVLVSSLGLIVHSSQGLPSRFPAEIQRVADRNAMWRWQCPTQIELSGHKFCNFGANWSQSKHKILLWGDSHALHYAPIVQAAIESHDDVSVTLHFGCAAGYGDIVHKRDPSPSRTEAACRSAYEKTHKLLTDHPEISTVMLAGAWMGAGLYASGSGMKNNSTKLLELSFSAIAKKLAAPHRKFFILGQVPAWPNANIRDCYLANAILRRACSASRTTQTLATYRERANPMNAALSAAAAAHSNMTFINVGERFCSPSECIIEIDHTLIYRDDGHLRRDLSPQVRARLAALTGIDTIIAAVTRTDRTR